MGTENLQKVQKLQNLQKLQLRELKIIKEEGEKNLQGLLNTFDVLSNKSDNLMKVLIPIMVVVIGYAIGVVYNGNKDERLIIAILIVIVLGLTIYFLYSNILPTKTVIMGAEPDNLCGDNIVSLNMDIEGVQPNEKVEWLIFYNRIDSIQLAIDETKKIHAERYNRFKKANQILMIGLLIIVCLFLLLQAYHLFRCKC